MAHVATSGHEILIDANPGLVVEVTLPAQARNVGSLGAFVNSLSLVMPVTLPEGQEAPAIWVGRNDYPSHNPQLPKELRSGESMTWLWRGHLVRGGSGSERPSRHRSLPDGSSPWIC